ncbi:MAG: DedA family protein [Pirellulales bacterium]
MGEWMMEFAEQWGYWGVAALMIAENILPPIPSEVVMPWAGFAVKNGKMAFWGVVLAGSLGSLIGTLPWYYLGKWIGHDRLHDWVQRHGAWLAVSGREFNRSIRWFERNGSITVVVCSLVPGVRTLISLPAGLAGMPLLKFLTLSATGTVTWTTGLAALGYYLGDKHELVETYLGPLSLIVVGGLIAWWLFRVIQQQAWRKSSS